MRYAILSDIHANLEAFTAVLNDLSKRGIDSIWCLGDIVDYGPDPCGCLYLLRRQKYVAVPGNHDLAAIGVIDTADFVPDAVESNRWTREQLQASHIEFLSSLPSVIEEEDFTLVHASPRDPIWEYLNSADRARENLPYFKSPFCLFGHTHRPVIFRCLKNGSCVTADFSEEADFSLEGGRLFLNPGSVGQPRDGDPRASYAVYDSETKTIRLCRVPYDVAATQSKMLKNKLPPGLILRLSYGL
ncbi:MAG: metallophosphoesterase family protein [Dehalococcoidales bacterium]|nr:metallophosphoesterase family protein [Dehalococcoidales bacterium]